VANQPASATLTTVGDTLVLRNSTNAKYARAVFTNTYTGLSGSWQGSNEGTDSTYVNLTAMREDTGGLVSGAFSLSATNCSIASAINNWNYVRFKVTAISTGSVDVRIDPLPSISLPLGVSPIALSSVTSAVTSASANAFAVGAAGTTAPTFNVDASASSVATGWGIVGAAAASGASLAVISSGTNENGTIDAKGSGTLTINGTATGAITLARATGVTGALTVTSTSASSLAVGRQGATTPTLKVDSSTSSQAAGLSIVGAASGSGVAVAAIGGTNEPLTLDAKGSGTITIGATSTGAVTIGATSQALIIPGPQTMGIGASTAAAGTTTSDAGALPAGTASVYPTTGADDTKGVVIHASDKVTGRKIFIGNGVSNKILKVYPASGGTINGAGADVAFSSASGKGVVIVCLSSGSNTWLAS